jgi:hypothetical protein
MFIHDLFYNYFGIHSFQKGKNIWPKKIEAIFKMLIPKTPHKIEVFNGMAQLYWCLIKKIGFFKAPITKLFKKIEVFEWTIECQIAWEDIKINQYVEFPILISPN